MNRNHKTTLKTRNPDEVLPLDPSRIHSEAQTPNRHHSIGRAVVTLAELAAHKPLELKAAELLEGNVGCTVTAVLVLPDGHRGITGVLAGVHRPRGLTDLRAGQLAELTFDITTENNITFERMPLESLVSISRTSRKAASSMS